MRARTTAGRCRRRRCSKRPGFDHAVDWPNDERPYAFGPERGLVMLPAAAELDDAQAMLVRKLQPRDWGGR